ncbi:TraB/GumN family protein [Sphingobacterium sp. HJSM2_6]|uniref:TraB/GumN family protein n=1 Tax=Sphingobacterium sp. HJSM2_6 TaxID=3366264 RepID=UPI003BD11A6A
MKKITLSIFAVLLSIGVFAQNQSLLWKVSGKGLTKDSYVLGTIHMACKEDFILKEKVKNAVQAVDALAFEVDLSKPEAMQKIQQYMKPDPDFFKGYDPQKKKVIDSIMTSYNLPPAVFDQISPVGVISLLTMRSFACKGMEDIKMMEREIQTLETASGKPVVELETPEFQFELLKEIFTPEDFYSYLTHEGAELEIKKLVKAYFAENVEELEKLLINTSYMTAENQAKLLDTRNHAWLEKMPNLMKEKSYLFSVGAAHLLGEHGVLKLLKDKGYKLTPVLD